MLKNTLIESLDYLGCGAAMLLVWEWLRPIEGLPSQWPLIILAIAGFIIPIIFRVKRK